MSDRTPRPDPERLTRDPELGPLIARANNSYRARLDEAEAFRRLSERMQPRRRWVLGWPQVALGATLGLAAGVVLMLQLTGAEPGPVAFGPELTRRARPASAPVPRDERAASSALETGQLEDDPLETGQPEVGQQPERAPEPTQLDDDPRLDEARRAARKSERVLDREGPDREGARREPHATRPLPSEPRSTPRPPAAQNDPRVESGAEPRIDCLDLARQGDRSGAESCFAQRGAGTGLSAEMALYELARLRRDVLRDAAGALSALDDYRRRFPRGSLEHEVDITRVELLSDLGRNREALSESQALLASPTGKERAAELHLLRGHIYRRASDWKAADNEYAQVEALGGTTAAEATRLRGVSLEGLGDSAGALAAYRRYLAGSEQPRKAEVERRVEALSAASRAPAPTP